MANHKSAKKRARQNERRNLVNRSYLSQVKTATRKLAEEVQKGAGGEAVEKLYRSAQSLVQRASTKGILHRNAAARRVARLTRMVARGGATKSS